MTVAYSVDSTVDSLVLCLVEHWVALTAATKAL